MPFKKQTAGTRARALANGYRSGLEERIAEELLATGISAEYEAGKVYFLQPAKPRSYTWDFALPNGIVIETKGRFQTEDRVKHKLIKDQHPDLDVRFVFSNANTRLSKGSPTTYAAWCSKYGFQYATKSVPVEWINEPRCEKRIKALEAAGTKPSSTK